MRVVAVVGTMPFPRLVALLGELRRIRPDLRIWAQHAAGGLADGIEGAPFEPRDRLIERLRAADAVVCHGGSGTVRDAILAGHTPVVVPRLSRLGELVNDHQLEIRDAFAGEIRFVPDPTPEALWDALRDAASRRGAPVVEAGHALSEEIASRLLARTPSRRAGVVWALLRASAFWCPVRRARDGDR